MNHVVFNLGQQKAGTTARIPIIGNAVNVILLDATNYAKYKRGSGYTYAAGGYVKRSPVAVQIPSDGTWHLVVDLGGTEGRAQVGQVTLIKPEP